ncbi:MAG: Uma2 family endonuclease [Thermomicrobiales bacterium]|nr:Uma2 family endonuclease [Thermomicrobiales bacterium]
MVAQVFESERPWTYTDLAGLPDDGNRYEILQGELIASPSPSPTHQRALVRLSLALEEAVNRSKFGTMFVAPVDVRFSDNNVVEPDIFVVSVDQYSQVHDQRLDGAPAFVIEIVSPSSVKSDRQRKATLYMENGVREYWIVEPDQQRILVHVAGEQGPRIVIDGSLESVVVPSFSVQLSDIFAPLLTSFN